MWVFSQPKKIRLINNFLQVTFILVNLIFSQKKIDQNFICSQTKSSSRVFSETSSLTEDQGKIDITYYKIDFEIDFNSEQILGSVIANGFVGMDQPDYIEFDFSDEMIVDSVWFNNEGIGFDHIDDIIKIPAQVSNPEGYNFSCQIFYHGSPPTSGSGSYNFAVGITSAAAGELTLSMGSTMTSDIKPGRYVYDLMLIRPNGDKTIVLEGSITVRPGISTNCP